jgi:hypothetical protein
MQMELNAVKGTGHPLGTIGLESASPGLHTRTGWYCEEKVENDTNGNYHDVNW